MKVLLNATAAELRAVSGDATYQSDLVRHSRDALHFDLLPGRPALESLKRRILWHAARRGLPGFLRRPLFIASQRLGGIGECGADALHTHLHLPRDVADVRRRVPVVFSSAGLSPPEYYRYVGRGTYEDVVAFYDRVGREVDLIVVWTESCARRLRDACPGMAAPVRVIPPFAEQGSLISRDRAGAVRFLFAGQQPGRKGLDVALQAFRLARARVPRMELTVISRDIPTDMVDAARGCDGIQILSTFVERGQMVQRIDEADVILLPSRAETFGMLVLEAMARGRAVLTSDVDPFPEIAPHGRVGFNVPVGNIGALADRMVELAEDRALLGRLREGAWEWVRERYSSGRVLPMLLGAYKEALDRRRITSAPAGR